MQIRGSRAAAVACALVAFAAAAALPPGAAAAAEGKRAAGKPLRYKTPAGVAFEVTADGLSSVRFMGREVAAGGWAAFNAESWFKNSGSGAVKVDPQPKKSVESDAKGNTARVRHEAGDVVCTYDYAFEGEDVTIAARVENNHATEPLNVVGFRGLTFAFDRPATGLMMVQHASYFQEHGVALMHPGHWSRIGGSHAADDSIGVGVSPWNTGLSRTLILWDYADWAQDKRDNDPRRKLTYFAQGPVPPRGAATFDVRIRVSPDRDWKHLLAPYKEHFERTYGPVQYKADPRWIATDYLNHSQKAVARDNPYGFHSGHRRIDTPAGAKRFCEALIPGLKKSDGQGVIVWGQGGDDPRGAMYRPDFDVLPPEVEAHFEQIAAQFKRAGLKFGVTTRPRDVAVKLDWGTDQVIDLNPDSPLHREMLWRRFDNMRKRGCTMFYLDTFGDRLEDVKLMRFLREKLGPDVLTFCEHQCDAMLPFSGGYSETTFDPAAAAKAGAASPYRLWSGVDNWEVYRWLVPGAQMASRLYEVKGKIPRGAPPDEFFAAHGVTPLVPVNDFPARLPALGAKNGTGKKRNAR
jgi:hypothetical protein